MSVINVVFLTFSLVSLAQYSFGLCHAISPNGTSEESVDTVASPDVNANDVILVPVLHETLNDVVLTNLHAMIPADKLVVISGSQVKPSGVSINTDNLKILGTMSVTNAVTFVDVPFTPMNGHLVPDGGNATACENDISSADIVLPVILD